MNTFFADTMDFLGNIVHNKGVFIQSDTNEINILWANYNFTNALIYCVNFNFQVNFRGVRQCGYDFRKIFAIS